MIDEQLKQRIKDANEITDVIGQFVSLHKRGINYIGTCPFHPDRHPSMTVSPSRQTYKCFVCGKGGDVIQFVQDHEGMSFNEAVTWLANRAGIPLPERIMSADEISKAKEREAQRIAMRAATAFFRKHLPDAQSYLYSRGYNLDDKVIADFQIGYAPQDNKAKGELLAAGFSKQRLIETGILAETDKGYVYDVFRDRIMFPYLDLKGNVVGYSGRYVTPQEKVGKYVNTGDTPLFRKGLHLFGLYQARAAIARYDNVYLVEGQFDVTSMHKAGVCNVIAGGGTALTPEQVQLIGRFTKKVTLMYDSDAAGIKAALKHCETFLSAGFQVSAVALQAGTDPDDLAQRLKADTGQWVMNHTVNFVGYFAPLLRGGSPGADPNKEEEAMQQICRLLAAIPSETLRLKSIEAAARQFDTNTEVMCRSVNNLLRSKKTAGVKPKSQMHPGIYGLEMLKETRSGNEPVILTRDYQEFITLYGDTPIAYVHGVSMQSDIIQLRQSGTLFTTECDGLHILKDGSESPYLTSLVSMYRAGITAITVSVEKYPSAGDEENRDEEDGYPEENENCIESWNFAKYYIYLHKEFFKTFNGERSPYVERCAEVISYADDSVRIINFTVFHGWLGLTKQALTEILKPHLAKRKSRMAINAQRTDDDYEDENYDPDELPRYVQDNPEYMQMFKQCNYYPKLNKQGEPVCYLFKNEKSGHTMVGDFYMIPLLHIYSDNEEENKRVLKINRRYYKTPLYIEVQSKTLAKKSSIEEKLLNLEAVNFTNGEEKHWTKIREYMSRHYV
ncbi:DNA primase, partial [uncultured Bacteroides sp.]